MGEGLFPWGPGCVHNYCHHLAGARSGTCWQARPCPTSGRLEVERKLPKSWLSAAAHWILRLLQASQFTA